MIFTEEDYKLAKKRAETQGLLVNNACGIKGVVNGHLGEICFFNYFKNKYRIVHINHRHYDFMLENLKIEIKTKQVNNLKIKSFYTNKVSSHNPNQECDYYIFLRLKYITSSSGIIKFCGCISKQQFLNQSIFKNNYFHIHMSKCYSFDDFIVLLNKKRISNGNIVTTNTTISKLIKILFFD